MSIMETAAREKRSAEKICSLDDACDLTEINSIGEPLESATKARKSVTKPHTGTPTSEKRGIPGNSPFKNSPSVSASPKNGLPPTYLDTICEIIGKWPGLDKWAVMREGEKMREMRYQGKSEEIVKSGFQNIFSTQSKKESPRIQGWNFGLTDAEGRVVSGKTVCRWLLAGVDPKSVQLWEAPSIPLAPENCDRATASDSRHNNNITIKEPESSMYVRQTVGTDEGGLTFEGPAIDGTREIPGLTKGVQRPSILQDTAPCGNTHNQELSLQQIDGAESIKDRYVSPREPMVRSESAEKDAYDEWSERAQGDYWGFQVRLKKKTLLKLRGAEESLKQLSCKSSELKISRDRDTVQLIELEKKIQTLRERIRQGETESEWVHQKESVASEAVSDLREQIRDVDEKLHRYWAEDD